MTVEKMKNMTFEKTDYEQWKELAIASLKGKPFEKLKTVTLEGIEIQPLYFEAANLNNSAVVSSMKQNPGWIIAQQTIASSGAAFLTQLEDSIEKGNESIVYDGEHPIDWNDDQLLQLATFIAKYPIFLFNVKIDDPILRAFDFVHHEVREAVSGIVQVEEWTIPVGYKKIRTAGADLWKVHHAGADAVTELAVALSEASRIATGFESFQTFEDSFYVRFPIDSHFFMEIAKLRAFRILWQAFAQAFEVIEPSKVPVFAVTSLRSYSKLDPYVNILRAGNETFSAILGGADIIQAHPHNILTGPDASSLRYSRNMQLVLREETLVEKVLDPAGGSYFIEKLTEQLVDEAWKLFLEIESNGGIEQFSKTGRLVEKSLQLQNDTATGKRSLIGTNVYAELTSVNIDDWPTLGQVQRLAEPFEQLRHRCIEKQPKTVILTFGELKDFKPRADFVTGFLATGGIRSSWSPAFERAEQAIEWLASEKPDYAIVCAAEQNIMEVMEALLVQLPKGILLDIAGKIDEETFRKWKHNGLNGTVFSSQNKIEKLNDILDLWQGGLQK